MKLLVDIGNSRCKSAIERDGELEPLETFAWRDAFLHTALNNAWIRALGGAVPESIHVSNVAGELLLPNMSAWCCRTWGLKPIAVESSASFQGLRNAYPDSMMFGVDRWAAMIGARGSYPGALCVIDSGTATTVDVIRADGIHIGGAILPGIFTMRRSLGKYTSALFAADGEINPFSDNTADGIAGGTGFAAVGAIDRLIWEARRAVGEITSVVTGGEAPVLQPLLQEEHVTDPLLVLKGVQVLSDAMCDVTRLTEARCDIADLGLQ